MCGIVGVVCKENCCDYIFKGLRRVQYRGYDSVGICQKAGESIQIDKTKGLIDKLIEKTKPLKGAQVAMGHTRWATHGEVNEENAHPIAGKNQQWVIVHNGIIENYSSLISQLQKEGEIAKTQTDSEAIALLLSLNNFEDPIKNMLWAKRQLKGSYAFCAVKKQDKNCLYAAKYKSPLYAYCNGEIAMVASDPICFPQGDYYKLEDGQMCKVSDGEMVFYDNDGNIIYPSKQKYKKISSDCDKDGYQHYMLKEIYQTPEALARLAKNFLNTNFDKLKKVKFNKVKLIGCGSAYHSCLIGAEYFKKYLKADAEAAYASEFRYSSEIINSKTLCIFVSQSGETADTIAAAEKAIKKHAKIVVLTNVLHSTLASLGQFVFPISAGSEIAVASTKAYSCQVAGLYLLVMALKGERSFYQSVRNVVQLSKTLEKFFINMSDFAQDIYQKNKIYFIGKGCDYITALEAALKLKEVSYINCWAMPAGELKHGTLSLIERNTPVIVISTNKSVDDKVMNSALEAKSRGAKLYLIAYKPPQENQLENFAFCLSLPKCCQPLKSILAIIPMQLLSYNVSILKGLNPDMPRNLAKSVTVE